MRVLVPLLLVVASTAVLSAPTAGACHILELEPLTASVPPGIDVFLAADYSGCPHQPTLCVVVAWAPSTLVYVCPYP